MSKKYIVEIDDGADYVETRGYGVYIPDYVIDRYEVGDLEEYKEGE